MKRLLLALTILVSAGGLVCALQNAAARAGRQAAAHSQALMTETQLLAQARIQLTSMTEQVHMLKQKLEAQEGVPAGPGEGLSALMASPICRPVKVSNCWPSWASTGAAPLTTSSSPKILCALCR